MDQAILGEDQGDCQRLPEEVQQGRLVALEEEEKGAGQVRCSLSEESLGGRCIDGP